MRILIGCEESAIVRVKFAELGHDCISCDLQPSRIHGQHYQGDIFDIINYPFDLAIFHPPCTHTAVSGSKFFDEKKRDGRQYAGVAFFMRLIKESQHIPMRCFEHPISIMSTLYRKPDQIIHPWQFGHGETKATCLWLFGLPPLIPTNVVDGRDHRVHRMSPGPNRARARSETYGGIAEAMAGQWGKLK